MTHRLLVLPLVLTLGCASLTAKLPHLSDGSLDVKTLLVWAEQGIEADCLIQGVDAKACVIGLPALKALEQKDAASIKTALIALMTEIPATGIYTQWLVNLL